MQTTKTCEMSTINPPWHDCLRHLSCFHHCGPGFEICMTASPLSSPSTVSTHHTISMHYVGLASPAHGLLHISNSKMVEKYHTLNLKSDSVVVDNSLAHSDVVPVFLVYSIKSDLIYALSTHSEFCWGF